MTKEQILDEFDEYCFKNDIHADTETAEAFVNWLLLKKKNFMLHSNNY